jgi:hypothetical protein
MQRIGFIGRSSIDQLLAGSSAGFAFARNAAGVTGLSSPQAELVRHIPGSWFQQ